MNQGLKQKLNLFSLTLFGIGIIIGAGVYAVLGAAAGHAGNSLWLSFLLAAATAYLTAFSYCELATLFPKAGAEYIYFKNAFPDNKLPSFLLGFVLILAAAATAATVSIGFGGYLKQFLDFPELAAAFILLVVVTIINSLGVESSSKTNLIFTLLEVLGLIFVIWFGFSSKPIALPDLKVTAGTLTASSLIFFVYLGFEHISNLAEETTNPEKNIPRAFMISLTITTILYIAVAIAATRLATPEALSESSQPLSEVISNVAPGWVNVLGAIALFSTANTALITMLAISRMVYGIARGGDLPKFLTKTSGENKTPIIAGIFALLCAAAFLLLGGLEILANISSFAALCGFLAVNVALITLRFKRPDLKRPFKSPINIGKMPVIPVLAIITIIAMCTQFQKEVYFVTTALLFTGVLIFYFTKRFR